MTAETRTMRFSWHAMVPEEDAQQIIDAAMMRASKRWRIHDITTRFLPRDIPRAIGIVDLVWTYGPVHGGRPDDGRKFIERVLNDALGRTLTKDIRLDYPDVIVLEEELSTPVEFLKPFAGG